MYGVIFYINAIFRAGKKLSIVHVYYDNKNLCVTEVFKVLVIGGPYATKLAPVYEEFLRWKERLSAEFLAYLASSEFT